ncbi:hypothetical protein [Cohnella mopanensis]|uniref:hypothetical protein n=1 Tax=Cohnella mopanensis TaxID=2911966 RepID=UPI001EF79F87|nr:hypothetical protein [Cohnella mopanensis]
MIRSLLLERATFNVTFSLLVKARRKIHALEMADFLFNKNNVTMDSIRLVNEEGSDKLFFLENIESIRWDYAEMTDYSNLFKAVGHISLTLRTDRIPESMEPSTREYHYRLPKSAIKDRTIWVIPTTNEPAFTQVIHQSLEFYCLTTDSLPYINAG